MFLKMCKINIISLSNNNWTQITRAVKAVRVFFIYIQCGNVKYEQVFNWYCWIEYLNKLYRLCHYLDEFCITCRVWNYLNSIYLKFQGTSMSPYPTESIIWYPKRSLTVFVNVIPVKIVFSSWFFPPQKFNILGTLVETGGFTGKNKCYSVTTIVINTFSLKRHIGINKVLFYILCKYF